MTPQPTIRIWWDTTVLAYRVTSPYNKELVDFLGKSIPVSDRSFDTQTKIWTVVEKQLPPLLAFLTLMQMKPVVVTRQQVEATAAQSQTSGAQAAQRGRPLDTVILEFVRLLPYDAARKAYRAAALDLHPDKNNGDGSRMTTLNADWDRIAKEVYGQS